MLSQCQVDQFKTEGYTIVEHFLNDTEVSILLQELYDLKATGAGTNVATNGDGQTQSTDSVNFQLVPLSPTSETYRDLPFSRKVRETVQQLIGDSFFLLLDQIFLKPARQGAGTNWHQDNAYFKIHDPTHGTGMWIALHDATIENGTMHIIPSSHEKQFDHERDPGSNHHITCIVDEEREHIVPVEVKAGGVLFFNFGIAHCTKGNTTDGDRAGMALHFLSTVELPPEHTRNRTKPMLSGEEYTRGEFEWGANLEGAWEARVEATV